MKEELQRITDLFIANRDVIKKCFKWNGDLMALAGSTILTGCNKKAEEDSLKKCEKIIKDRSGALSEFRGNMMIPLLCQMLMSSDPEQYFTDVMTVYQMMNKSKILGSDTKLMAAMTIRNHCEVNQAEKYASSTEKIFQHMKEEHKWLTSDSDIPFAAMLAVSDLNVEVLMEEIERCFVLLKKKFSGDPAQSLSHVLALIKGSSEEKCSRVIRIFDGLKAAKHTYGQYQELAALGTLVELDLPDDQIIQEIIDTDIYLKKQKGFGSLSIGTSARRMYAALNVLNAHKSDNETANNALMGSALALTVSLEVCMILILFM